MEAIEVGGSEALDEQDTPPQSPTIAPESVQRVVRAVTEELDKKDVQRPFYGMIVDGVHSHPNSVRVSDRELGVSSC